MGGFDQSELSREKNNKQRFAVILILLASVLQIQIDHSLVVIDVGFQSYICIEVLCDSIIELQCR